MEKGIKFRAWSGEGMISPDYISRTGSAHWLENSIPCYTKEVMRYTGLKDKNGKEIFESDIVQIDGTKNYEHCLPSPKEKEYVGRFLVNVDLGMHGFDFSWYPISGYECSTHIIGSENVSGNLENVEIVGNIYENPDLLER